MQARCSGLWRERESASTFAPAAANRRIAFACVGKRASSCVSMCVWGGGAWQQRDTGYYTNRETGDYTRTDVG